MPAHESSMPLLRPIPIPTKGHHFFRRIWNWMTYIRQWEVAENYIMYIEYLNCYILIPGTYKDGDKTTPGFIFDGASIPKILTNLLAPTGILFMPGLAHDFGYKYGHLLSPSGIKMFEGMPQAFFDEMFDKISLQVNGMKIPSFLAWGALRCFGFLAWNGHRKVKATTEKMFPHLTLTTIRAKK